MLDLLHSLLYDKPTEPLAISEVSMATGKQPIFHVADKLIAHQPHSEGIAVEAKKESWEVLPGLRPHDARKGQLVFRRDSNRH